MPQVKLIVSKATGRYNIPSEIATLIDCETARILKVAWITGASFGDFRTMNDFVKSMQADGYQIVNLGDEFDKRYYVRLLARFKQVFGLGYAMGVVMSNGDVRQCYTVEDVIAAGFAPALL